MVGSFKYDLLVGSGNFLVLLKGSSDDGLIHKKVESKLDGPDSGSAF